MKLECLSRFLQVVSQGVEMLGSLSKDT